jgi:5'-phosphate synthase pdxT subunit
MRVGILALQGDVPEHRAAIAPLLGAGTLQEVRRPEELVGLDGLLMPGGESTTMSKLLRKAGLADPLTDLIRRGLPVLATCAGLILLARDLAPGRGGEEPLPLGLLDVRVRRNEYGRQVDSFEAPLRIPAIGSAPYHGVFIRAPRILAVGAEAEPIAFRGSEVVGVRQGRIWGLTFHPELSDDPRLHAAWIASLRAGGQPTTTQRRNAARSTPPTRAAPQ